MSKTPPNFSLGNDKRDEFLIFNLEEFTQDTLCSTMARLRSVKPVIHYWPFQGGGSGVFLCCLFLVSEFRYCFTLHYTLVRFGLLSGHLLANSCPLGWPLFSLYFVYLWFGYFPFWFWERNLPSDRSSSISLLSRYFLYQSIHNGKFVYKKHSLELYIDRWLLRKDWATRIFSVRNRFDLIPKHFSTSREISNNFANCDRLPPSLPPPPLPSPQSE